MSAAAFIELGITGYPLGHSLSPEIHAAALAGCGLVGAYRLYPLSPGPDILAELAQLLGQVRRGEIHGLNVTIPHKQAVLTLVDRLSPAAQAIGAVNTILVRDGVLIGDNTDAEGFLSELRKLIPSFTLASIVDECPVECLVLGAGGSARAITYALATSGCRVTIASRRIEQAQILVDDFKRIASSALSALPLTRAALTAWAAEANRSGAHPLLVNCTPLGMSPHKAESPWPEDLLLPVNASVYDLIYNPAETPLIRLARRSGLPAYNGLGMLVEQAALAFELWTGLKAPRPAMWAAVEAKNVPAS